MEEKKKKMVITGIIVIALIGLLVGYFQFFIINKSGFAPPIGCPTPLGLVQDNRTETDITFLIVSVPYGANLQGSEVKLYHRGDLTEISKVNLLSSNNTLLASYYSDFKWLYQNGTTVNDLDLEAGMIFEIIGEISRGDAIVFSSNEWYFGQTQVTVS